MYQHFTAKNIVKRFSFQSEIVPLKSIQLRKQSMEIPHFLWKSSVDVVQQTAGQCMKTAAALL